MISTASKPAWEARRAAATNSILQNPQFRIGYHRLARIYPGPIVQFRLMDGDHFAVTVAAGVVSCGTR